MPLRSPSPLLLALVVQRALLSYGLITFRKISSTAALNVRWSSPMLQFCG